MTPHPSPFVNSVYHPIPVTSDISSSLFLHETAL